MGLRRGGVRTDIATMVGCGESDFRSSRHSFRAAARVEASHPAAAAGPGRERADENKTDPQEDRPFMHRKAALS